MNLPIGKRELLQQPGDGVNVAEDRYGLPDQMNGANNGSVKTQMGAIGHPLQAMEESHVLESVRQELAMAKRMFGTHFAQQLSLEMQACAQVGRYQCPVQSSRMMLNTLTGLDDYITPEDVLKNADNMEMITDMSPLAALKKS